MANLVVVAAAVLQSSQADAESGYLAGATLIAGEPVYLDANNTWQLAGAAIPASAGPNVTRGITINGAAAGQKVNVVKTDPNFKVGVAIVAGETYVVSATAGLICPIADLATGNGVTILGVAKDTAYLNLAPISVLATHA